MERYGTAVKADETAVKADGTAVKADEAAICLSAANLLFVDLT